MIIPRYLALFAATCVLVASTPVFARRRGGGGGDDQFPWLTEIVMYVLLGMLVLVIVSALWRYFTRPSAAELARERSTRRAFERETKATRRLRR